jgi:hypothetical protein
MITIYRRYIARSWTSDEFLMNLGEPHHDSHFASATSRSHACPVSVSAESEVDGAGAPLIFQSRKVGCYIYPVERKTPSFGAGI